METIFTILCDNSAKPLSPVMGEHGFACYIESENGNYLFDTGRGLGIVHNSLALRKKLSGIKAIMLSHGHMDHTGGLAKVLQLTGKRYVYAHPNIFAKKFNEATGRVRFVGIPFDRTYLESLGANFKLNTRLIETGKDIFLSGEIPRLNSFEKGDSGLFTYTATGEKIQPDPLKDDLSLMVNTDKGLVVVLGCAHAGMINIMNYAMENLGTDRIHAIIGGTHLIASSDEQFDETLKWLDEHEVEHIGVSHCTGLIKASLLHAKLENRFFFASVGTEFKA